MRRRSGSIRSTTVGGAGRCSGEKPQARVGRASGSNQEPTDFKEDRICCEGGRDAEVVEEGLHTDAEGLVVAVHASPDGGFAPHAGAADSGEDRADDLVAEGKQRGDGAGGLRGDAVAP